MSGEDDNRAGALGVEVRRGQKGQNNASLVHMDGFETHLAESFGEPRGACLLSKARRGNRADFGLPVENCLRVSMQPREGGVHRPLGGECGNARKCCGCDGRRHGSG